MAPACPNDCPEGTGQVLGEPAPNSSSAWGSHTSPIISAEKRARPACTALLWATEKGGGVPLTSPTRNSRFPPGPTSDVWLRQSASVTITDSGPGEADWGQRGALGRAGWEQELALAECLGAARCGHHHNESLWFGTFWSRATPRSQCSSRRSVRGPALPTKLTYRLSQTSRSRGPGNPQ